MKLLKQAVSVISNFRHRIDISDQRQKLANQNFERPTLPTLFYATLYAILLLSAQYCYTSALKKGNIGICSTVYSLGFIFPTLSGSLFWNERLTGLNIIGILMVIPTIIISGMSSSKNRQHKNKNINTYVCSSIIFTINDFFRILCDTNIF